MENDIHTLYNDNRTIQIKQNYLMESKLNFLE